MRVRTEGDLLHEVCARYRLATYMTHRFSRASIGS